MKKWSAVLLVVALLVAVLSLPAYACVPVTSLQVSQVVQGNWDRHLYWGLDKDANPASLVLSVGQQQAVQYTVTVFQEGYTDTYHATGQIHIQNATGEPDQRTAFIAYVDDAIEARVAGTWVEVLRMNLSGPFTIPTGGEANLDFDIPFDLVAGAVAYRNVVYVGLENQSPQPGHFHEYVNRQCFTLPDAPLVIDRCVDVNDSFAGFLGTACYPDGPFTFTYSRWVGPYDVCGSYTVDNTATFVTNDTGTTGSDSQTVFIDVPCIGCTLTPGYWKTHSEYGPAPYDDTWALLPNGANTPFFDTGLTWYTMFWTTPQGGNAYYILAHAYGAAYLNGLNGADTSAVAGELAHAAYLLDQYDGNPMPMSRIRGAVRTDFINTASVLDQYNNGYIGPGHCTE
ncbi:MAG: hypothetical protein ONB14_12835 [candidate division KSB1 bacterium]|nr:hypothetical protein [candidate division KSB1 bacterium]